jgi:hypothetical protein
MIAFGGYAATRSFTPSGFAASARREGVQACLVGAPWQTTQRRGAAPGSRESGPMPQRPSEGRASGKTLTDRLLEATFASKPRRRELSRAFSRDLMKMFGLR